MFKVFYTLFELSTSNFLLILNCITLQSRAIQTRLELDNPTKLPNADPISARTEGPIGR